MAPHRTKYSTTMNAVSFKKPYEDVFLSSGGKRSSLEYTEIFSGSSSIPVLDLSGMDARVGSDEARKLDYSNIFGDLRNDDVAVPFEELFTNGSIQKSKTRIPADVHPSGKMSLRHPSDGVKQELNISFNRNSDASHVLHPVSGFTCFVDGNLKQKTQGGGHVPSLKCKVVKDKGGLSCQKLYEADKPYNSLEPQLASDVSHDKTHSRSSVPKEDASKEITGEPSPPFSNEEYDENSVAAAALVKAIDQAQESIRIAKMIMERKKKGYQDGSKPRSRKVLGEETKIDHEAYVPKENNARGKYTLKDSIFTGIKGTVTAPHRLNVDAGNTVVERVRENVETAKQHGSVFARGANLFAPNCNHNSETLHVDERVELKKLGENIKAAETHGETTFFPGLVANAECKSADLKSEKVAYNNSLMLSTSKLAYHLGELITGKEQRETCVDHTKEPGVGTELPERTQEQEKSVEEAGQYPVTFDHVEDSKSMVERVLNTSRRTREQEKIVSEPCENLRIIQDNEVTEERYSDADDHGKLEKKIEEHEEWLDAEQLTVPTSEFDSSLNELCNLVGNEMLEPEEVMKISENVTEWKENGLRQGKPYVEENGKHPCYESKEKVKEVSQEDTYGRITDIFPEIGEAEKLVNEVYEPENDDKKQEQNHYHDGDEPELAREHEQSEGKEGNMKTSAYDATENIVKEEISYEGTHNTLTGAEISGENHNKCEFPEAGYIGDAVVANRTDARTVFNNDHANDTVTIFSEAKEAYNIDLNSKAEEHQHAVKIYKENDVVPDVTGTFSATDKDEEAEQLFHLEGNEVPGMDSLRRSASEGLFPDGKTENVGIMDAYPEDKLPEDDDALKSTNEIPDAKIKGRNLPDVSRALKPSELDEGSVSKSNFENIDEVSGHGSAESTKGTNSDKEELRDELETLSNGRKSSKEQSDGMCSQLSSEPCVKTERPVEGGLNMEKNKEDHVGTSPMEEKDTKAGLRDDNQQRLEAIKREREREKERLAVERAIREARERAFADARERAERASVERAAAEVRQRFIAETLEKHGKASRWKQPADKASKEAKLRTERAAVERATVEARERALEKAMSQKTHTQAHRYPSERISSGLKNNFSSTDPENGIDTESAQRRQARLERHQRIMERAAKSLEEKNMRDRVAQKEQAERNKLAECVDADVKRWANGKVGNLRALLSTLQYILGGDSDSGWQAISVTEMITTVAVKKAYRKATLCVHPDKLQQRGASIQQKYICEKVFDLLKAAWNRFNSEEM